MRGSVAGSLWGLVLGGAGLGIASQVSGPSLTGQIQDAPPALAAPELAATDDVTVNSEDMVGETELNAQVPAPLEAVEAETTSPEPETAPAAVPEATEIETILAAPDDITEPEVEIVQDDPVAVATPTPLADVGDEEEVADVVADDEASDDAAVLTETQASPTSDPDVRAGSEEDMVVASNDVAMSIMPTDAAPVESEIVPSDQPIADSVDEAMMDEAPLEEEAGEEAQSMEVIEDASPRVEAPAAAEVEIETPAEDEIAVAVPPAEPAAVPDVVVAPVDEQPTKVETAQAPNEALPATNTVRVNRPGAEPSSPAGQEAEIVPEVAEVEEGPALVRFAAEFENPNGLPLISIVLLDDGQMADAVETVVGLPIPVTVVLNPLVQNTGARMAAYRDQGVEVGMQMSLPAGATPIDVEVAFEAAFGTVDEAVMLFSDGTGLLQSDRSVTEQVMQVLAADGRGLVMVQRGLSNAMRMAEQSDVPAAAILRDLDGDGQEEAAIVRALDQAAFRARQTGDAVLLARMTPQTLGALAAWSGDAQDDQISVAPVTAVLLATSE